MEQYNAERDAVDRRNKNFRGIRLSYLSTLAEEMDKEIKFFSVKEGKEGDFDERIRGKDDILWQLAGQPDDFYHWAIKEPIKFSGDWEEYLEVVDMHQNLTLEHVSQYVRYLLQNNNEKKTFLDIKPGLASAPFHCAYIVCPRKESLRDVVQSIQRHVQRKKMRVTENEYYVWIDVLCSEDFLIEDQYTGKENEKKAIERIENELDQIWQKIPHFVERLIYIRVLYDPSVLKRIWCIWELFAACYHRDKSVSLIFANKTNFARNTRVEFNKFLERIMNLDPSLMISRNQIIRDTVMKKFETLEKGFAVAVMKVKKRLCKFILSQAVRDIKGLRPFMLDTQTECGTWYVDVANLMMMRANDKSVNQQDLQKMYGVCLDWALDIASNLPPVETIDVTAKGKKAAKKREKQKQEEETHKQDRLILLIEHALADTARARNIPGLNYLTDGEHIIKYMEEFANEFGVKIPDENDVLMQSMKNVGRNKGRPRSKLRLPSYINPRKSTKKIPQSPLPLLAEGVLPDKTDEGFNDLQFSKDDDENGLVKAMDYAMNISRTNEARSETPVEVTTGLVAPPDSLRASTQQKAERTQNAEFFDSVKVAGTRPINENERKEIERQKRMKAMVDFEVRRLLIMNKISEAHNVAYSAAIKYGKNSGKVYFGWLLVHDIRFKLGKSLYEQGKYAQAADNYAKSAEEDRHVFKKKNEQYRYRRSGFYESLAHYMNNKPMRALTWLDSVFFGLTLGSTVRGDKSPEEMNIPSKCSKRSVQALKLAELCLIEMRKEVDKDPTTLAKDVKLLDDIITAVGKQTRAACIAVYGRKFEGEGKEELYNARLRKILPQVDF